MFTNIKKIKMLVSEVVRASAEYMKKEFLREKLQSTIVDLVRSGAITSQKELDDVLKTFEMALNALKMIPFDVYKKMSEVKN